jgi:dTMP kinase
VEVGVSRILRGRTALKYHEAGMDLGLSNDPAESFKLFQGIIKGQYDAMADKEGFHIIDGTLPIEEQQQQMRAIAKAMLRRYKQPFITYDRSSANHEEVNE